MTTTTRDIKANLLVKLEHARTLTMAGNASEAGYILSDVIDALSSSRVTVTQYRGTDTSRPGDCTDVSELISRNID